MTLASSIQQLFERHAGKVVDHRTLSYWVSRIAGGELSLDDLQQKIFEGPEYKARIEGVYRQIFAEQAPFLPYAEGFFTDFWTKVASNNPVEYPAFVFHVRALKEVAEHILTSNASAKLDRYRADIDFDLAMCLAQQQQLAQVEDAPRQKLEAHALKVMTIDDEASNDNNPTTTNQTKNEEERNCYDRTKLSELERVFERPLYVPEYFKYSTSTHENVLTMKAQQESMMNRLADVYASYKQATLSEWEFVNTYLFDIDEPGFLENFIQDVVASSTYRINMIKACQDWYYKLYGSGLSDYDANIVFQLARQCSYSLVDSRISEALTSFKEETDAFEVEVHATYGKILERPPDAAECTAEVRMFRSAKGTQSVQTSVHELEIRLMNTLEFHDVIKQRIKDEYQEVFGCNISLSKLFSVLTDVVTRLPSLTSFDAVQPCITALVNPAS